MACNERYLPSGVFLVKASVSSFFWPTIFSNSTRQMASNRGNLSYKAASFSVLIEVTSDVQELI